MAKSLLLCFFLASIIFLIIDVIWLSITVKTIYRPALGLLINDKPVMWAAALFYIIYVVSLTLIILRPALDNESVFQAFWTGAVFGIVTYGTYNLTNMATIKDWSPTIVWIDMIWGGFLTKFCFININLSNQNFLSILK
jgi:Predicted membrane protein